MERFFPIGTDIGIIHLKSPKESVTLEEESTHFAAVFRNKLRTLKMILTAAISLE
jgi:hypothetical protein